MVSSHLIRYETRNQRSSATCSRMECILLCTASVSSMCWNKGQSIIKKKITKVRFSPVPELSLAQKGENEAPESLFGCPDSKNQHWP